MEEWWESGCGVCVTQLCQTLWKNDGNQGCVCMCVLLAQLCLTLCNPMDCSPPGSSVHGDCPDENNGVGCLLLVGSSSR